MASGFGWRRSAIVVGILLLLSVPVGIYFKPQAVVYFEIRSILKRDKWRLPILQSAPRPLNDTAASTSPGTELSYFGYRFEVPWEGIGRERNEGRVARVEFQSGPTVTCTNPRFFQEDPIERKRSVYPALFDRAFGPAPKLSKFEQFREMMSWTPEQLRLFCSREAFARSVTFLQFKADWFGWDPAVPEIFSVRTPHYRGFETNRRSKGEQRVALILFDPEDRWFRVTVSTLRSDVRITQPEINRIIRTFGPAPSNAPNRTVK